MRYGKPFLDVIIKYVKRMMSSALMIL